MLKKISILIVVSFFSLLCSFGQSVEIEVEEKPLNEVLVEIRDRYNIQISFDDQLLSKYKISEKKTYSSPENAVKKLIARLPLSFEKNGDVFVIFPSTKKKKPASFICAGQVVDRGTHESLPFSHIVINGKTLVADLSGNFAHSSTSDSLFSVRFSYLGYYILDTVLYAGSGKTIPLVPSVIGLNEIVVKNNPIEKSTQVGDQAGIMKINHKIATFLPGYSDNSLLNLLRLHPGILASGEQTNDLIIWGSYEGHSKVLFDNFTIYGLKNFNDNISAFNPLVAKDVEVYKGGFDVRYGDRVGGIVNATGKNGNMLKPSFTLSVNNMTLNGLAELPVGKKSSLLLAARQTYYNLYNADDLNIFGQRQQKTLQQNGGKNNLNENTSNGSSGAGTIQLLGNRRLNNVDLNIYPDYTFHDANMKFTSRFDNGDLFFFSLYGGSDRFSYNIDETINLIGNIISADISKNTHEENLQVGGAMFYGKQWDNGSLTNVHINYSTIQNEYQDKYQVVNIRRNEKLFEITDKLSENKLSEGVVKVDHRLLVNDYHSLEGGISAIYNKAELSESNLDTDPVLIADDEVRLNLFIQDNILFAKDVNVKLGVRVNYPTSINRIFFEPRVSASYEVTNHWKVNAAMGKYNQFVAKSSLVDDEGDYRYLWVVCDNEDVPVLSAGHYVLGTSYHFQDFTFSLEGYWKSTNGLTRYRGALGKRQDGVFNGQSRSKGLDLFIKKDYKGHSAWIAYSLSKTSELFTYFRNSEYMRAPQDQRHEIKVAGLFNFDPFFISGNYVYGSGFPEAVPLNNQNVPNGPDYSRFDASFVYKFLNKKVKGEVGLSILNVFNNENIKQSNFEKVPNFQTNTINIHAEAIPFTPTLFLKLTY